ncbi:hypothetical protein ACFXTI_005751 [Malus domestica]
MTLNATRTMRSSLTSRTSFPRTPNSAKSTLSPPRRCHFSRCSDLDMGRGIVGLNGRGEMGVKKMKRGRKPKVKVLGSENEGYMSMGMVNKVGTAVDISGLEKPAKTEG